ncbi:tRNA (cytidine(34)-2'-O)-methyltransferase [Marinibaculum pumilum]|uniref:tRNA (cytidine(34)-2'-O)-methyltransferase n=1 Tax=Marinibaculum pumilum TaxID=1766165 RepID=A0ABV7L4N2_9PROT
MRVALYQPDMPPNVGTILRLGACLGVPVDIIEPCGFPFSHRGLRRAGIDYLDKVAVARHRDWPAFERTLGGHRLVLLTTAGSLPHTGFAFRPGDRLLFGQESAGVPPAVHDRADARLRIPMRPGLRSLNVAVAAAMVLGEALRQTGGFPDPHGPAIPDPPEGEIDAP